MPLFSATLKKCVPIISVFFSLFFVSNSLAITTISQTSIGTSYNQVATGAYDQGQTFVALVGGTVNFLKLPIWRFQNVGGVGSTCQPFIWDTTTGLAQSGSIVTLGTSVPTSNLNTWANFTSFAGVGTIIKGHTYFVTANCGTATQVGNTQWLGSLSDVLTGGIFGTTTDHGVTMRSTSTLADGGIVLDVTPTTTQVSFTSTPLSTCDFQNFGIHEYFSATDQSNCLNPSNPECSAGVAVSAGYSDGNTYPLNYNSGGIGPFVDPNYIFKSGAFTSGTVYYARAYICSRSNAGDCYVGKNSNSNLLATSDEWRFIVDGLDTCSTTYFAQDLIPTPSSSSTAGTFNNATNIINQQCQSFSDGTVFGGIVYGICKVLALAFVPSQDSLDQISSLRTLVQNKPPFGYFTAYSASINSLTNIQTGTSTIATTSPDFFTNVTLFVTQPWYQTLLTIVRACLWVFFGFAVYKFFKHFTPNS